MAEHIDILLTFDCKSFVEKIVEARVKLAQFFYRLYPEKNLEECLKAFNLLQELAEYYEKRNHKS